jgi:hypothetical protein
MDYSIMNVMTQSQHFLPHLAISLLAIFNLMKIYLSSLSRKYSHGQN